MRSRMAGSARCSTNARSAAPAPALEGELQRHEQRRRQRAEGDIGAPQALRQPALTGATPAPPATAVTMLS